MRIIAGSAKSRPLTVPRGVTIRPTSDMVREALFASLAARTIDCRFGDLYAGSGSVGLEALSRGAAACVFIERDPRCVQALRANLQATGLGDRAEIVRGEALTRIESVWRRGPLDIVFMDPPYGDSAEPLLRRVLELARADAYPCLVVVECARGGEPSLTPTKDKRYGNTRLLYYDTTAEPPAERP